MQLDHTHVVIRLRKFSEIGDLTMVMIRQYPASLLIGFVAGASVWAIANALLLSWIPINEAAYGLDDEEAAAEIYRYMGWMALLVMLQTPAAGVLTTYYLGQAVFEKRPTWASVFAEIKRQFWRWIWVLGVRRLAIPAMILVAVRWGQPAWWGWDLAVPLGLMLFIAAVRSNRPFVPEILLLEQCPLRSKSESEISMKRRSKSLQAPIASDLCSRFVVVSIVFSWFLLSVLYTLIWCRGIVLGQWNFMDLFVLLVLYPLSLWTVAGVSVVIRLLGYLDTRIRLEGWEVELAIRAEAIRQFGEDTGLTVRPQQHSSTTQANTQPPSAPILEAIEVVTPTEAS